MHTLTHYGIVDLSKYFSIFVLYTLKTCDCKRVFVYIDRNARTSSYKIKKLDTSTLFAYQINCIIVKDDDYNYQN